MPVYYDHANKLWFPARGPEVAGSNPAPATKTETRGAATLPFDLLLINPQDVLNIHYPKEHRSFSPLVQLV